MSKKIMIEDIINSKAADDNFKGDKVFKEIQNAVKDSSEGVVLDFSNIELVNTAFLNNAIGQLFNREIYNISKNNVTISNMETSMIDLLKESISVASEKYS